MAGCHSRTLPDPNNPKDVGGAISPATLRGNLRAVTDSLGTRWEKGEFNEATYRQLVTKAADELVQGVDSEKVSPDQAWEYGEVLRDAHRWADAEKVLRIAVKFAKVTKNEDRRVNDTLRLARAIAEQGRAKEAIDMARQCFNASPRESAPILLAVYLEIAPAAKGHGADVELAKLIEDATVVHLRTSVDPKSDAGKMFLMAKNFHVRKALELAANLYDSAGRHDLADRARAKVSGSDRLIST